MLDYIIIILFFFFCYRLIKRLGSSFPLFELTIVLYLLQYGIAPIFMYSFNSNDYMSMAIEKSDYLLFITISIVAFILGLFSVKQRIDLKKIKISSQKASITGRILVVIGLVSTLAMSILPESLHSIINFFVSFKTIGLYSLVFSNKKLDKILLIIMFIEIGLGAIINALLIEFIIFSIFFAMFFTLRYEISKKIKIIAIAFSFLFLVVYQGVKNEYRNSVWGSELEFEAKVGILTNLISYDSFVASTKIDFKNNESLLTTMHRLNQGWHVSKVINYVPRNVSFQYGSELINDIFSAFLPRFLWPTKRVVSDYKRFNYYTGYNLSSTTAMTIGVIGDFYINFGFLGTIILMFLFGYLLAKFINLFYKLYIVKSSINIIWLPFIFSYLIRPGNEFYMVINHLIKGMVILYFFNKLFIYQLLKNKYEK